MSSACLEGVLTVSHGSENKAAREGDPVLTAADMSAIKGLAGIEIDFLSLSHTQSAADVQFSRKILQSLGFANVKVGYDCFADFRVPDPNDCSNSSQMLAV